ncbi:hypothetical protein ACOMHN_011553 [Nucella lapillus]
MASLYALPEEVLLKIFSYLQPEDLMFGVRRTCHYFHDLSLEPSLWTHVTVTNFSPEILFSVDADRPVSNFVCEKFYRKLLQQKCIRRGVGGCEGSGPKKKRQTGKGSDTVPIRRVIRSFEERGKVWFRCSATRHLFIPHLQRLTLDRQRWQSMDVVAKYSALQHLDVKVDDDSFPSRDVGKPKGWYVISVFETLKCLAKLKTLKFIDLNNQAHIPAVTNSMVEYFSTGPPLKQIEIAMFVNDKILKAILSHCLQLEILALVKPKLPSKCSFTAVSKDPRRLLSLRVEHCQNLNDDCLKSMALIFPNLKSLHLSLTVKMTDDGVGCLLKACPQLTSLKLISPERATNEDARNTGDSGEITIHGHCLEELSGNLQCLVLENFVYLSNPVFENLCRRQQNLRTIELRRCVVDNSDLMALVGSCRLLQTVTVRDCPAVDSAGVSFLMTNLPRLQTLNCQLHPSRVMKLKQLQPSRKRTRSGGLVLLDQPRTWLSSLELDACQELTDANVSALASLCPYLRSLRLRGANLVNDHTVRMVLRSFPQLKHLHLSAVSRDAVENKLTVVGLRHLIRWGRCLQSLELVTPHRSFTINDLANFVVCSSSLVNLTVPMDPDRDGGRCYSSFDTINKLKRKTEEKTNERKTVVATIICMSPFSLMKVKIFHGPNIIDNIAVKLGQGP